MASSASMPGTSSTGQPSSRTTSWIGSICCTSGSGIGARLALYSGYQSSRKVLPLRVEHAGRVLAPDIARAAASASRPCRGSRRWEAVGPAQVGQRVVGPVQVAGTVDQQHGLRRSSRHCRASPVRAGRRCVESRACARRHRCGRCTASPPALPRPASRRPCAARPEPPLPARTAAAAAARRPSGRHADADGDRGRRRAHRRDCACAARPQRISVQSKVGHGQGLRDHRRRRAARDSVAGPRRHRASAPGACSTSVGSSRWRSTPKSVFDEADCAVPAPGPGRADRPAGHPLGHREHQLLRHHARAASGC